MNDSRKTIVIVGAGISGLSAGIYAEQNGFHAIILEKNPRVGGLCTGWYRQGRLCDGCIHWLTGTREGTVLYEDWKNVGALTTQDKIIYLPSWGTFEYKGTKLTFWRDLKRAEKEWCEVSPKDRRRIHHFFKMVDDFTKVELPLKKPIEKLRFSEILKLGFTVGRVWPSYLLSMFQSCESYAKKFKHPAIRWALTHAQPGDGNLFSMVYSYATVVYGNGGIPEGGSHAMSERMKDRFLSLGGTLIMNSEVDHIIVKNKKVLGVQLTNGKDILGDYVITALDPNYVVTRLLYGLYKNPRIERRFHDPVKNPTPSCVLLNFEVENIPDLPIPYSFETEPFYVGGIKISHLTLRSYAFDPKSFVKDNKTVMSVLVDQYATEYEYWKNLYKDRNSYLKKKNQIGDMIMARIIDKFPEMKGHIKLLDIATPKTLNRYTNASRGAFMGFLFTSKKSMFSHPGTMKGLKNLYMAGQWFQAPGGLPLAMVEGKFAVQRICKKEKLSMFFKEQYAQLKRKKAFNK